MTLPTALREPRLKISWCVQRKVYLSVDGGCCSHQAGLQISHFVCPELDICSALALSRSSTPSRHQNINNKFTATCAPFCRRKEMVQLRIQHQQSHTNKTPPGHKPCLLFGLIWPKADVNYLHLKKEIHKFFKRDKKGEQKACILRHTNREIYYTSKFRILSISLKFMNFMT
jgi:hypothetical protein